MQIAGSQCECCERPIVFADEGKLCGGCGLAVHGSCEKRESCPRCGELFQNYEPPKAGVLEDAFVPREKRSSNAVGPFGAALFGLLIFLLLFVVILIS